MRAPRLAAAAAFVAMLALAACAPEPQPTPSPEPTTSTAPVPGPTGDASSPTPTADPGDPAPSPSEPSSSEPSPPVPAPDALPADCTAAYSPAMQEQLLAAFGQLNPDVSYTSSKIGDLQDIMQGAPSLACLWTPPGQTALMSTASLITEQQIAQVRDVLTQNFAGCEDTPQQLVCSRAGEQIQGAKETETATLRGTTLVTTLGLNAEPALLDAAVDDLLAHLP